MTSGFKRCAKRTTENCHIQLANVKCCPEFIIYINIIIWHAQVLHKKFVSNYV